MLIFFISSHLSFCSLVNCCIIALLCFCSSISNKNIHCFSTRWTSPCSQIWAFTLEVQCYYYWWTKPFQNHSETETPSEIQSERQSSHSRDWWTGFFSESLPADKKLPLMNELLLFCIFCCCIFISCEHASKQIKRQVDLLTGTTYASGSALTVTQREEETNMNDSFSYMWNKRDGSI